MLIGVEIPTGVHLFPGEEAKLPNVPGTYLFTKPKRQVATVWIHCSASDDPNADNVATIRKWHLARGFADTGYHFYIRKTGQVEFGRPLEFIPAAQEGHNTGSIAICLGGLEAARFTEAQFTTLRSLCAQINAAYGGFLTFHGHREVANKLCPVFDYKAVLKLDGVGRLGKG